MLKKLQKLHAKKGFTLTELIIVVAILAVLIAAAAAFSYPVQQMVKATAVTADAITVNEIVGEYIQGRLAYSDCLFIHYAVNSPLLTGQTNINESMVAINTKLTSANAGKAGALIFRYVENSDEPEKSGYMLYDFPITTSTSYNSFLDATGGSIKLKDSGKVYDDVFYGSTQRIIYLPHQLPKTNSVRGEVYMNFEIMSYAGDPDYLVYSGGAVDQSQSVYINSLALSGIYQNAEATPPTTTTLDRLGLIKKGDANTSSFVLQNFTAGAKNEPGKSRLDQPGNFRMYPDADTPITGNGSDIIIFYHIPKFSS